MSQEEFDRLVAALREQAHAWLGNATIEQLERLIAHTEHLRAVLIKKVNS
jgi:hypothetical protein